MTERLQSARILTHSREALARHSRLRGAWVTDLPLQLAVILAGGLAYVGNYVLLNHVFSAEELRHLAIVNAEKVIHLERRLHIFTEADLQRYAETHVLIGHVLTVTYIWLHLPLIVATAIWLYSRHRPIFVLTRNAMLIAGLIALAWEYWPVAPPHLVPSLEVVNSAASRVYDIVEPKGFFDSYGAVPSIHVSWSLQMAVAIWLAAPRHRLRLAAPALPVLMSLGVVATGNHYWFDVATGIPVAIAGYLPAALVRLRGGRRRELPYSPWF